MDSIEQDAGAESGPLTVSAEHAALYAGDCGDLPLETRRVLAQLLAGPFIDKQRHSKLWPVLERDQNIVARRLADIFLELVMDADVGIAFVRQADTGELETPVLLRRAPLTFMDSVLLLNLRARLGRASAAGERAVVDKDELVEELSPYQRADKTDYAGFAKRCAAAIQKMKEHSILQKLPGEETRFEISPTLRLLFSLDEIMALEEQYRALLNNSGASATAAQDEESDHE